MAGRANFPLVLSIWLVVPAILGLAGAERWSRQVSSSEWIPLADPRNQQGHNQNIVPPLLPQVHQPLIPGSLPPELRQEYQQQLIQLQKTQESIQRLLLLQQQLKAQQQLLQGQGFLPNEMSESEENKQALHQSTIANAQTLPKLTPEVLPPQLSGQPRPPVYTSQNFHESQGEALRQEQYEDYNDRQAEDYRNSQREREELREKVRYVPEAPSNPENDGESSDDGEEEVQVVYVPAEILAQRGQTKSQQRSRDRKQFGNEDTRNHQERPYANQQGSLDSSSHQRENVPTTVSPEDDAYAREFLQQLQREHEGTDRLLKEAREKELERLREERKEIQRRAKLQQAAVQREQEIQRQREAEKKRKELAKLEEAAKQRELERIRESRERQRLEEIERSKKAQARANEEKRKQEENRQAEIERLAALERQKKAEIERTIAAQKDLERLQKEDEERAREAERSHLARQKETSRIRNDNTEASPQAQPLIRNHHGNRQHLGQSGKYNRHGRIRNKPRQRQHGENIENSDRIVQETTTITPPSPNQPPLAVYMSNLIGDTRVIRITDVLKTLKDAKTIDVLDNVGQNAPQVFVGPSNLEVPGLYAKFDLPYLSSIDNNRVERRVDKLPFFVAPLSFNPPPGYSKIPFPAPHIGSVVINNLDSNIPITQPDGSLEEVRKSNLSPLIEPNSFSDDSSKGISYSTNYDSSTTPTYANSRHEPSSTPQYQSTPSYSSVEASGPGSSYRFRESFVSEPPSASGSQEPSKLTYHDQSQLRPIYQEESPVPLAHNTATQYNGDSARSTTPVYRQPNVVTSFPYQESSQTVSSSTPIYQQSYSNVRDDSSNAPANSQISSADRDASLHREVVNRYQLTDQRKNEPGQEYPSGQVDSGVIRYEDSPTGPTQYNLPAELPPIHPQLPGLVNSLLGEDEQPASISRQPTVPRTESTTATKTITTTETPITTQKSRGRHRGRLVATRPSTTTTTTLSPPSKSRDADRTRRPFGRTRSRFTTTTEEYRETYEPTKTKVTATTPRYNIQDNYRRPVSTKTQKSKNRETEASLHHSRNQVHNVQAHEAANARNPLSDTNSRQPETTGGDPNEMAYAQYDFPSVTTSRENYPIQDSDGSRIENIPGEVEYTKTSNSHGSKAPTPGSLQIQEGPISQQFQERYPTSDLSQTSLEDAPINGFNYQIRNEQATMTPFIPPGSKEFNYYRNKQETFDNLQIPVAPTNVPIKSQYNDYQRPTFYENSGISRPQSHFPINEDKNSGFEVSDDGIYDPYSRDNEDGLRATGFVSEQAPLELTTEALTTTTTTEAAPVVIRQKVRGRLGGRRRPDSLIQTKPRGSQDEYVRFSAVNEQNTQTTERPASRNRENQRVKPKTRQQHHGVQIQTEGNDYVRIQAPIRTYQKTIVTPPSTTPRTTTTQAPTTTTTEYDTSNDELEYGFIRAPNFAPINPVENRYQNSYRPADNQAHLQSILPIDETAADSIPSHAQVSRNRPKYQSPNRRPTSKTVSSTTLTSDTSPYTERPRPRVEEPRNNRIRSRGRKPGKKRTTTTTTTTTEYVLEENNDLPLDENYPHPVQTLVDFGNDRQEFYNEKFEALPLASGASTNPVQQQHRENSFSGRDLLLNFESESEQLPNSELDQTQLASQSSRKYGQPVGTRSRTHQHHRAAQDRDIYGSESQWSTKLTSSSFQPSRSVNKLTQNNQKALSTSENEKNKYSNDQATADVPEVITAPPEESYVTILVTSDESSEKSVKPSADVSLESSSMEGTNYGMKTSFESRHIPMERTTPTSIGQDTHVSNSTNATDSNEDGKYKESVHEKQPLRKTGGRRRRVRVRVRPAVSDDFVTAESQHFNSAVKNLLQDRAKYNQRDEESRETLATTRSSIFDEHTSADTPKKTILEDLLDEVFENDNKTSTNSEVTTPIKSEVALSTSDQSEVVSAPSEVIPDQTKDITSKVIPDQSEQVSNQSQVISNEPQLISNKSEIVSNKSEVISNDSEVNLNKSEVASDQFNVVPTTTNESEVVGSSENSNDESNVEQTTYFIEENSSNVNPSNANEFTTNAPLMTTMTIPRKSWDSTKPYKDSLALNNAEHFSYSKPINENTKFDDDNAGHGNKVFENDYREEMAKDDDNSLSENNEEENYPKNHRSEWSEVRYPTNSEFYDYNRQSNLTTTHLPAGIVTKSDGDTSVKTLSDYVKAIFDTMKNADEQNRKNETYFSSTDSLSRDDERVATRSYDTSRTSDDSVNVPTTLSSSFDYSTMNFEKSVYSTEKSILNLTGIEEVEKNEEKARVPVNTENLILNGTEEYAEQSRIMENAETTKSTVERTEASTEMNAIDSTSLPINTEFSTTTTTVETVNPGEPKINEIAFSTTENLPTTKNSTRTKLGAVLRTSTTTKVSHMTEICYRGRCVMTKPKKEIHAR